VQCLLNIPPTPYPELDQTEQDLSFLRALYGNYQQFIGFDKKCVCVCVCVCTYVCVYMRVKTRLVKKKLANL